METSVARQAAAMALALLIGGGLGLVYDLLRPLRRYAGKTGALLLDILFCMASGAASFIYAMGAGEGKLGICQLVAMTAGFLLYLYLVSDILRSRAESRKKEKT